MNSLHWHRFIYKILKTIITPFLKRKFNYSYEKIKPTNHPYIVLANHNTDYDPLLVTLAFSDQMYYVASEHIFRWGFISKLINFIVAPIPRVKGTTEIQTVMSILKRLKLGANVCMFAEGNRSFSSETGEIHPATGKLIKKSGVSLITFRLDGGYFTSPRWSKTLRKGGMKGRIVKEYSPEELKSMTSDEIYSAIKNDLYVNAYEEQEKNPIEYKGKNLAENLETALYLCPECKKTETLKSEGDRLVCDCGLDLNYDSYGYLSSNNEKEAPFKTILDWCRFQDTWLKEDIERIKSMSHDELIYSDKDQTLWEANRGKNKLMGRGTLLLYNDRMVFDYGDNTRFTFSFRDLYDLEIIGQMVIAFATTDRQAYEIKSSHPRSALKYRDLLKYIKAK